MTMHSHRLAAAVAGAILVAAGCGGDDSDPTSDTTAAAPADTTSVPDTTPTTEADPAPSTEPPVTDPTADTTSGTTGTTGTADTTAGATPVETAAFDLPTLPDLITPLETIVTDPAADPLAFARELGGFPYDIPVPDGSTLAGLDVDVTAVEGDEGPIHRHEFVYSAVAPGGTVPDVDITLDGNGPGSAHVVEVWDPIMTGLGFERANSTASDPGDPGGPNSVNHVYVPTAVVPAVVNGVLAVPGNVFVWADEDVLGGGSSIDPGEILGGYRIDADAETEVTDPVAVPLLASLAEAFPVPDAATIDDAELRLLRRPPDAFEIDEGAAYVAVVLEWTVAGSTVEEIATPLADPATFDGGPFLPAEESFFAVGTYEIVEGTDYGTDDWRQPILLLNRYDGVLFVEAPDEPGGAVTISLRLDLNPNDAELAPPAD